MDRLVVLGGLLVVILAAPSAQSQPGTGNGLMVALRELQRRLSEEELPTRHTRGGASETPDLPPLETRQMRRCKRRPCWQVIAMLNKVPGATKRSQLERRLNVRETQPSQWHDSPALPDHSQPNPNKRTTTDPTGQLTCDQMSAIHQMFVDAGTMLPEAKEDFDIACDVYLADSS